MGQKSKYQTSLGIPTTPTKIVLREHFVPNQRQRNSAPSINIKFAELRGWATTSNIKYVSNFPTRSPTIINFELPNNSLINPIS